MSLYHPHISRLINIKSELGEVYLNRLIQSLAISMIGIFVPIYLLNLGYSLTQAGLYLLVVSFVSGIISPLSALLNSKIGVKHTVIINFPFLLIHFALLFSIQEFNWPIYYIAAAYGAALAFYWIPINSDFAKNSDKIHRGKEIGYLTAIPTMASVFAPLIGGWIIASYSFNILIMIVSLLLLTSLIPLFLTSDYKSKMGYSWGEMFSKHNLIFFKEFFAEGMLLAAITIWPIFVYTILIDYVSIGSALALAALGSAISMIYVGKLSDEINKSTLLKKGGVLYSIPWIISIFVTITLQVFVISFIRGMLWALITIPLFAAACDQANKRSVTEFMVLREWGLCLGRLFMYGAFLLTLSTFNFQIVFILTALASLYFFFVKY